MLGQVLGNDGIYSKPSQVLFKYMEKLMSILDKTLKLYIMDEYMDAITILSNILTKLTETKPLFKNYSAVENVIWSENEFQWAKSYDLENLSVEWYSPGKNELKIVEKIYEKYLKSQIELLDQWMAGKIKLDREEVRKCLRILVNIIYRSSILLPPLKSETQSIFENNLEKSQHYPKLSLKNGQPIREYILDCIQRLQTYLLKRYNILIVLKLTSIP